MEKDEDGYINLEPGDGINIAGLGIVGLLPDWVGERPVGK